MFQNIFQNNLDQQIAAHFLVSQTDFGVVFFTIISFFGNWQFLIPCALSIVLILILENKKKIIIPFIFVVAGSELITFLGKILFQRPRPGGIIFSIWDFSFPSGHATAAIAFYGFLAYILNKLSHGKFRLLIIVVTLLLAGFVGYSRLYLGVHYVSDVLAGYAVGLVFLLIGIYFAEKRSGRKRPI